MPLYDFNCRDCGQPFEKLVRNEAEIATVACPQCESKQIEKLISLPAKPVVAAGASHSPGPACGQGPPCGAPWCGRKG